MTTGLVVSIAKVIPVELPAISYTVNLYIHSQVIIVPLLYQVFKYVFPLSPLKIAPEK